jgi:hypothetical protein
MWIAHDLRSVFCDPMKAYSVRWLFSDINSGKPWFFAVNISAPVASHELCSLSAT